ncbi:hypothetical protein EVAR_363_1 [Eumeta japonica]|uniref:Uncharacterized protein n=1 Tax=Eumeta variegata TaxID=151549 RepID=A0A4C1SD04_EUMVA|nr:hypothetical protein EVAR_363_1 [Eumeta japonica]
MGYGQNLAGNDVDQRPISRMALSCFAKTGSLIVKRKTKLQEDSEGAGGNDTAARTWEFKHLRMARRINREAKPICRKQPLLLSGNSLEAITRAGIIFYYTLANI